MVTPARKTINAACDTVVEMGLGAFVGACYSRVFTALNPSHGAVFCAASVLISKIVKPVFQAIFDGPDANWSSKFVGDFLGTAVGTVSSAAIATRLGYAITVSSGATLTLAMTALPFFITLAGAAAIELVKFASSHMYKA